MPIQAITPRAIDHPDVPFDTLTYSVEIVTEIVDGNLRCFARLRLRRARKVTETVTNAETGETSTVERWEADKEFPEVMRDLPDVFAACAEYPAMGAAMAYLNAAVDEFNRKNQLV